VEFPEPAFHAFENGNSVPSLDELEEIAIAPGVPIREFFYDSGKRSSLLHWLRLWWSKLR
jgi:hypothetical protein